jgi:hypothetical protein
MVLHLSSLPNIIFYVACVFLMIIGATGGMVNQKIRQKKLYYSLKTIGNQQRNDRGRDNVFLTSVGLKPSAKQYFFL